MPELENKIVRWFKSLGKGPSNSSNNLVLNEIDGRLTNQGTDFVQEERARLFIQMEDFKSAISILEILPSTQGQQLLLAECYFEVGKDVEAIGCVDHLQVIMTTCPRPKSNHLMELIDAYIAMSFNIRALILLLCASKIYELESVGKKPNETMAAIENCCYKCFCLIDVMVEQSGRMRAISEQFGPKFLMAMLENLRAIKDGNADKKLECEARCLNSIGLCYRALKNCHRSIKCFRIGVRLMKRRKNGTSSTYRILGDLLRNMGLVLHDFGNYPAASSLYLQSLNAYGKSEKIEAEWRKRKLSDRTKTI